MPWLLLAVSHWLAGEVDQADDLFADVAEEGLELGAHEVAAVALGERAAVAIGRGAMGRGGGVRRARRFGSSHRSRLDEYPTSAFVCALAARVALHRGEAQRAHELLARAQRLRPRLTYAIAAPRRPDAAWSLPAPTWRWPTPAAPRRCCARSTRCCADSQTSARFRLQVDELRASLKTMRADAPGASTLTEAELRLLPYLATHLSFPEIGERLYVSRHTVKSHGDGRLPQAQRQLPQRRGRARPRARTGLNAPAGGRLHAIGTMTRPDRGV